MTTSLSGQHLGHLKALQSRGPDAPTSEDVKALYKKQQALIKTQVDMGLYGGVSFNCQREGRQFIRTKLEEEQDTMQILLYS
eukprot:5628448-Ditylum_brightwellii.AAC.1